MTFLNPLVLFGLIAAAIPVILHLLNLRKLRTIEFSTLTFLKELQQTKIRRLKIRQILLLIVRTLLVILIVLAFARPALRGSLLGHIGTHAHSSVVFIFDDSFSMKATDEYGELFAQAKESIVQLIDLLSEGDEAYFIKLSDVPQATVETPTHDIQALRTLVKESQVSSIRRPIEDALRLSAKLLSTSKNANKEVYIVSDMQKTLFPADVSTLQRKQSASASLFDQSVKFFAITIGKQSIANVAIDSVDVVTKILEKEKPATIYASIRNFSEIKLQNYVVSVFLDGAHTAQQSIQAQPWGSAGISFIVTPKRTGFLQGYVELERDVLEQDNRRYFTMYIPERINVVVVSNSTADSKYPLLALQSSGGLLKNQQSTPQQLSFIDLKNVDVVMLVGAKSLSSSSIDRMKSFVEAGGGLILLPSSDTQPGDFNSSLLSTFSIPSIENVNKMPASQGSLSFQKIDFDHPLFTTVFEPTEKNKKREQTSLESPTITTSLKRQSGKQNRTIISLSDGSPFLSEHTMGNGKILFYSVAPTLSWSDFPLKGIFVPLLYRSALYVSSHEKVQTSFIAGDDFQLNLNTEVQSGQTSQLNLISPDGIGEFISRGSSSSFKAKRLTTPGLYQVKSGTTLLSVVPVNTDARESDDRKISQNEIAEFWNMLGISTSSVQTLDRRDQLQTAVMQSRFGVELWKYCLGLALLLALIEMLIARDSKKEVVSGTMTTVTK